jgi:YHS domain-containing protein
MKLSKYFFAYAVVSVTGGAVLVAVGCSKTSPIPIGRTSVNQASTDTRTSTDAGQSKASNLTTAETSKANNPVDGEHGHKPGSHGGIIIPIGSDSYHAEAVVERSGDLRLLTLGKDESRIQEVDSQLLKAYVKVVGQTDAMSIELTATPQDGDTSGKTSQFVGQLPEELRGKPLEVTIPNIRVNGERFRIGFTTVTANHQEEMPAGLPAAEEQALYLTPAGKYTEADIKANGSVTASQKFKGVLSSHDMKPKPGDRICPVTLTKANPKFTWIIDGKPYEFCCPPCVDEFVKTAKQQPDEVKLPDTYIK